MATFAAFYDANVLYPAELRNFLMHLALTGLFRAKWSAAVHEEWISNLLEKRPDLNRYEDLIPGLQLPDPDDRHVLAAAIRCGADVIVTMNLRDFPVSATKPFWIEVQHPDEFILQLFGSSPAAVISAARAHRESLRSPPRTPIEFLDILERQGLRQVAFTLSTLSRYLTASRWLASHALSPSSFFPPDV